MAGRVFERLRTRLLAGSALAGGILALMPGPAQAACVATFNPNSVTCGTTVTADTSSTDGAPPATDHRSYTYSAGGAVNVAVASGATVSGAGLGFISLEAGAAITMVNNGTVAQTAVGNAGLDGALNITQLAGGPVSYSGAGSVSTNQAATHALNVAANTGAITIDATGGLFQSTGGNGINVGALAAGGNVTIRATAAQVGTAASRVGGIGVSGTTANGNLTAEVGTVYASNHAVSLAISGLSSGNLSITTNGTLDSAAGTAITAIIVNAGSTGNLTVVQNGIATTGSHGIAASNLGSGATAVTVNGTVTSGGFGVSVIGQANTVTNNGAIAGTVGVISSSGATTVVNAGAISGTLNAVTLSGANNLFVMQGAGAALTGTALGSGTDTFRFAGTGSNTFNVAQIAAGWAALQKTDSSTWTLTGTATTAAPMTVSGGALRVNGDTTSFATTVNTGGTLGGTGTVGNTTIAGGTLAPGNSIGTLTVQGNLAFSTASTYLVEVSPSAADRTNVTGTASLAGTVRVVAAPGSYLKNSYTILSAGGLAGTFGAINAGGFFGELSYTTTDVILTLTAALSSQGLTGNPQTVAQAIDRFFNAGGTLPAGYTPLFGLTSTQLSNALSQLTGEVSAGGQQAAFQSTQSFLNLMLDPFVAGRGGNLGGAPTGFAAEPQPAMPDDVALAYARAMPVKASPMVYEPRWSVWGSAYGGTAQVDGNAAIGSTTTDSRVGGFAAGADYRLARDTAIGFALAGGGTSWSLANGLGSGQSDVFQAGVYGSHRFGPAYLSAALAYAWHDATTTRNVTIGAETLEGRFRPHVLAGRVEGGYRFDWMSMGVTPYVAAQVQSFRAPAYTETATAGAGTFALSYASQTETATRTELGVWADHRAWLSPHTELVLRGRAAWAHDFDTDRRINPGFVALPGASFTVDGASPSPDLALLSAVAELRLRGGVSLSAKFDGEFGSRSESYAATGTLRYSW